MNTIKIFYAYARRDKLLRDELEKHLEPLKRLGQITTWYDREIQPGKDWKREIENQINTADIILLLLSPNFVSSNYCYGQEMQRALEQQTKGAVHIIPIILRPVTWQELPIGNLQALPTDGKPVSNWRHRDDAFEDIVRGIHQVVIGYQLRKANQESTQYAHSTNSQDQRWNLFTSEFLLRMVHNLRVPLTSLTGYLELVTEFDEQLDPQMRNTFLQSAKRSQEEIELLANWLLELIFLQRQLVLKDFLFAELVHNVIQTTDQKLQEGHPLSLNIPEDLVIRADKEYVRLVLNHLLSNAWKYTPIGTPVAIYAVLPENGDELSSSSAQMIRVCVRDFGPGIPPHEMPLLFQPFQRLGRDLVGKIQGLGLGLYISKQLVETLGGHLSAKSTGISGDGCHFYFTLPM